MSGYEPATCTVCHVYQVRDCAGYVDGLCWPCRYDRDVDALRAQLAAETKRREEAEAVSDEASAEKVQWRSDYRDVEAALGRSQERERALAAQVARLRAAAAEMVAAIDADGPHTWNVEGFRLYDAAAGLRDVLGVAPLPNAPKPGCLHCGNPCTCGDRDDRIGEAILALAREGC